MRNDQLKNAVPVEIGDRCARAQAVGFQRCTNVDARPAAAGRIILEELVGLADVVEEVPI